MTNTTGPTDLASATYNPDYEEYDLFVEEYVSKRKWHLLPLVIYSLAFVLGLTGNGLVIFITGFRMKKTVNTIWFLNLAIADFIFTSFLPLNIVYLAIGTHWPFGLVMCKLNSTVTLLNLYASVYLLTVISIDRCISVRCPVWAQNHRTPRLALSVVLGVWVLALVLCSPKLYFRQTSPYYWMNESRIMCFDKYSNTSAQARIIHRAMITVQFTFAFVIPFSVIVCSYCAVVLRLRRSRLSPSNKTFKVITAVVVAFFVCWFPFHVFSFLDMKLAEQPNLFWVVFNGVPFAFSMACLNSCLNPILYVFMGNDFKEQLRRSLFSAFENAFTEQSNVNTTDTKNSLTHELVSPK